MHTILFLTLFSPLAVTQGNTSLPSSAHQAIAPVTKNTLSYCYITGTNVRMRETPSLQGRILGTFRYYESVEVIRWSNDSNWCRVRRSNGMSGWVYGDYIGDCEEGDR
ncbi:MAG: SH3 domain-containing protein [Flavobacteriales bacterium]